MKVTFLTSMLIAALLMAGCGKFGKSKGMPDDGQLHGVAPAGRYILPKPPGMVYVPPGTFHMEVGS